MNRALVVGVNTISEATIVDLKCVRTSKKQSPPPNTQCFTTIRRQYGMVLDLVETTEHVKSG